MKWTYQDLVITKGRHGSGVSLCRVPIRLVNALAPARGLELKSRETRA